MASDIKSVQEAIKLIDEVCRFYEIDNPQKLANWRNIANIIKGFLDKPEFFIREIIQNADDAKSKEVVIKVSGCHVEIQNDGEEFTKEQFKALSAIGKSTKRIGEFIGNFGIGFKSIFYYTDEVKLASGYLRWKYKSDTICIPFKDYDDVNGNIEYITGTRITFKLKDDKKEVFLEELKNFPKETILFLRNIRRIKIIIDDECEEISKEYLGDDRWKVIVSKNGLKLEKYFILKKDYVKLNKEQSLSFLKQKLRYEDEKEIKEHFGEVELPISVSISIRLKNEYEIDDEYNGHFYVFLPTQSKTYLPCNIHADFIIEQDRRFIVQTNEFNRLFVEKALELIKRVIEYYKNTKSDNERLQIYKWLRKAEFDRESEPLATYLHDAIREMFENEELILIDYSLYDDIDRVFFKKEEVINADEWLFNYLDKKKTYEYIHRYSERYQVHPEVIKILKEHNIEIKEFTFEDILRDLEYKPSLPPEPKKLLRFYQAIKDYWLNKPKNDEEVMKLINNAKFLLLEDKKTFASISSADRRIYYVNVKSKISDKYLNYARKYVYLLNKELVEEIKQAEDAEEIFNFLEEIGIRELTLRDIQDIIVEEINKNPENWKVLFAELINIHRDNPRKLDKLKLPCYTLKHPNKVKWCKPNEIYFSKAFKEILGYDLEVILRFSENTKFVVSDFLKDDFLELIEGSDAGEKKEIVFQFLETQGVKQRLEVKDDENNIIKLPKSWSRNPVEKAKEELKEFIEENNIDFSLEFFVGVPLQPYNSNIYPSKIFGYVFGIIDRKLEYQDEIAKELRKKDREYVINFSKMIIKHWNDYKHFLRLKLIYSYREVTYREGELEFGLSKFGKMLKEECWLLDSNDRPRSPLELFINTEDNQKLGLPIVNESITLPSDLIEFLELDRAPDIEYLLNRLEMAIKRGNKGEIEDLLWKIYLEASRNEKSKNKVKERLKEIPIWKDSKIELIPIENTCWMSQIKDDEFNKRQQQETILKVIIPLKDYYSEKLRDFFVNILEIPEIIPPKVFIDYYTKLMKKIEPLSTAEIAFVLNIYMNADSYGIRDEILNIKKLLNMNFQFVPESDIEFYCLNEDIADNLLPEIKERTLITPKKLKDKNVKDSIYEVLFEKLTDLGEVSKPRCIVEGETDYDIDFEKESLAHAIWNYYRGVVDTSKIKETCLRIHKIRIKKAKSIKIIYELDGKKITNDIDRTAFYDISKNTIYIVDEKAQNRYSALFQIKDALSKYLSTLKGIDELLSNCFDRPIEYVEEFLLSKGIKSIEKPSFEFEDMNTLISLTTTQDTSISKQISVMLPSASDKYIIEIKDKEKKSYTAHSTGESERVIDQIPEITSQAEAKIDLIKGIESPDQKSDLIEDTGSSDIFQEAEEQSHKRWKPECNPDEIDVKQISPKYIKPSGEETLDDHTKEIFPSAIPRGDYTIDKQIETLSDGDRRTIGRWGEEFVFRYLKEKYREKYEDKGIEIKENKGKTILKRNGHVLVEIHWLNYKRDEMKEYDIKVIEGDREWYIEVKSTIGGSKSYFEITLNQLIFAMKHSSNYYIYRVYKAGTKKPELVILKDPYGLWQEGKLKVYVDSMRIYV